MTTAANKYPSFFQVFLPERSSERLRIPIAFVTLTRLEESVPKEFVLRNCRGRVWNVEARGIGERICFDGGWKQFVEENSLQAADFIVFTYDGSNGFKFKIFGLSGCEKMEVKEEAEHGNVTEIEEEADEEDEETEINGLQEHEEKCVMEVEEEEEDDVSGDDEYNDSEDDDCTEMENMRFQRHHRGGKAPVVHKRATAGSSATKAGDPKDNGIDAEMYVHLDNPYFIAKQNKTRPSKLHIPKTLINDFSLSLPQSITLLCCQHIGRNEPRDHHLTLPEEPHIPKKHGRCTKEVDMWKDGRVCIKGWASFCRRNNIRIEKDACICEFVLGEDQEIEMLQVHVVKNGGTC